MPCLGIPRILLNRMKLFVQRVAPALPGKHPLRIMDGGKQSAWNIRLRSVTRS